MSWRAAAPWKGCGSKPHWKDCPYNLTPRRACSAWDSCRSRPPSSPRFRRCVRHWRTCAGRDTDWYFCDSATRNPSCATGAGGANSRVSAHFIDRGRCSARMDGSSAKDDPLLLVGIDSGWEGQGDGNPDHMSTYLTTWDSFLSACKVFSK